MESRIPAVVVARVGLFRDSLAAFLKIFPQVSPTIMVADVASAARAISGQQPAIVLIDVASLDCEIGRAIRQIKAQGHSCACLVLTDSRQEQQEAMQAGADEAVLRGFASRELFKAIGRLLKSLALPTGVSQLASPGRRGA